MSFGVIGRIIYPLNTPHDQKMGRTGEPRKGVLLRLPLEEMVRQGNCPGLGQAG